MTVALILLSLAALCFGIFGWLWLCAGFRRGGVRGGLGLAALQVSGLCLAYGVLRGQPMAGLFMASFPPLAAVVPVELAPFSRLISVLGWQVAPWAAAVLLVALALRPLRVWAPGLTLLAALVGGALLGEQVSETAMCQAAARRGVDRFQRDGFAASLTKGREPPVTVHGFAETGGTRLGWSYRLMDWYELPADLGVIRPETSVICTI